MPSNIYEALVSVLFFVSVSMWTTPNIYCTHRVLKNFVNDCNELSSIIFELQDWEMWYVSKITISNGLISPHIASHKQSETYTILLSLNKMKPIICNLMRMFWIAQGLFAIV